MLTNCNMTSVKQIINKMQERDSSFVEEVLILLRLLMKIDRKSNTILIINLVFTYPLQNQYIQLTMVLFREKLNWKHETILLMEGKRSPAIRKNFPEQLRFYYRYLCCFQNWVVSFYIYLTYFSMYEV